MTTAHVPTANGSAMNGATALVKSLEASGVDVMFGIPGGAILPAYDPIFDSTIRHILVRHEQGAGHAATGYAQVTGRAGVCIATSGPGATNLVTPLADAAMDSVPVVAITGQVPSAAIGTDAFQEADIRGITMPFTKHNYLVTNPNDIPRAIAEAFHIATTGRPGPVLVDIAKDALQAMTKYNWPTNLSLAGYKPRNTPAAQAISDAAALITQSSKPVFYVGGGVIKANASAELRQLAELLGAPNTTVWAIDGDGCFQMTNQELVTCALNNIPIKVAIINNESLGMVRQWQTLFYDSRYSNTSLESKRVPNFPMLAEAMGCVGLSCERPEDLDKTIEKAMSINDQPVVVDFRVHRDAMVWPMVAAGTSNDEIMIARATAPDWDSQEL